MQDFICWSFVYESIIAFVKWLIKDVTIIGLAQIVITAIIAYLTCILGRATKNLVSATKELVHVTKKNPNVICTIESNFKTQRKLFLIIRNTGDAPAFEIEVDIEAIQKPPLVEPLFKSGISILAPDKGFIPIMPSDLWVAPIKFKINTSWTSKIDGKRYKNPEYIIDYTGENRLGWHEAGLDQIAEAITK